MRPTSFNLNTAGGAEAYYGGSMLDALRCQLQQARAIEIATILNWTPRLTKLRAADGCKSDPDDARGWFLRSPAPPSASRQKWTAKRGNTHVVAVGRRRLDLG